MKDASSCLSSEDRRQAILAVTIAISHENQVVDRLKADDEFCSLHGAIVERRQQIERFEILLAKLKRM